jgi:hypothetical protein
VNFERIARAGLLVAILIATALDLARSGEGALEQPPVS